MTTLVASDLEAKVYNWLVKKGIVFQFQSQLIGGWHRQLGDAIVDFLLPEMNIVLRVMGEYWHSSADERGRDQVQKEALLAKGYIVVDLWTDDLTDRFDETMQLAVQGMEMA